jgi:predicted NAD/FAD-dependent oxidoreductase
MKMELDIAVIGAGMAGAAAARRLSDAGARVTIFDKSRGIGGRMATRRMDGGEFDHGAQFMRARGERFAARIAEWSAAGLVDLWDDDRHVGVPTMNAPVRALIGDIPVVSGFTATAIIRDGSRWRIAGGTEEMSDLFDLVVSAIPSPQAQPLLATAGWSPDGLGESRFAPCWSAMFGYANPIEIEDYVVLEDDTIAWIADNGSKPGRALDKSCIVVHATPEWSKAHLELEADEALAMLFMRFAGITGLMDEPSYGSAHRWRYAMVEKPLGQTHLWNASERLGACGDWCIGPRIEAAFDSGEALAEAIIAGS